MADAGTSKVDELLKGVDGDYKFSEKDVGWISGKIIDIGHIYLSLDITQAERTTLLRNNPNDHNNMKTEMMLLWRKKKGKQATLKTLVTSLVEDDLADDSSVSLAEEIVEHFKKKCTK
ncbi:uncharacterized protein [Dysidea avara]|uniref:uncharacterized protein n=1 Tax=Dysidea avara TaxID=196820 RepID=UPI00332AF8C0